MRNRIAFDRTGHSASPIDSHSWHRFQMWRGIAALALLSAVLSLQCVQRRPNEPGPVKYNVYFGSGGYNNIYVIELDSLLYSNAPPIIDSIPGFETITGMEASDDGRWLYVQSMHRARPYEPSLKKIDLLTKDTVAILPDDTESRLTTLADGIVMRGFDIFLSVIGCKREIIETNQMTVIDMLPDTVCGFNGPRTGTSIAATVDGTSRLRGLNVETGEYWGEYIARDPESEQTLHVVAAFLHPSDTLVAAIAMTGGAIRVWFLVGNLNSGEVVLSHRVSRGLGAVNMSSDGEFCIVTDPSDLHGGLPTVDVFDLVELVHLRRFTWAEGLEANPGECIFLPGGRYVLIASAPPPTGYVGYVDVIDLNHIEAIKPTLLPFSNLELGGLAIGVAQNN